MTSIPTQARRHIALPAAIFDTLEGRLYPGAGRPSEYEPAPICLGDVTFYRGAGYEPDWSQAPADLSGLFAPHDRARTPDTLGRVIGAGTALLLAMAAGFCTVLIVDIPSGIVRAAGF